MRSGMMPLAAALCCIFCQLTGIPVSWKKCELGSIVNWIGWQFNFRSGTVQIPTSKIQKLQGYLQDLFAFRQMQTQTTRKDHVLVDVDYTTFSTTSNLGSLFVH